MPGKGPLTSEPEHCQRVENPAFHGSSLRVEMPNSEKLACEFGVRFSEWGLEEPEEIYFRYYVYFAKDWKVTEKMVPQKNGQMKKMVLHGGKLPGVDGTYNRAGWGGRIDKDGTKGWSARMGDVLWDSELLGPPKRSPIPGWFSTGSPTAKVRLSFYSYPTPSYRRRSRRHHRLDDRIYFGVCLLF